MEMKCIVVTLAFCLLQMATASTNETHCNVCDDLREEMSALKRQVSELKMGMLSRDRRQAEAFAFTAIHDQEEQVHPGNILKFKNVLYNLGNMYNPATGIANIQMSGTYLFTYSIEHWRSSELVCTLMVDGANQVDVVIYPDGKSQQSSNAAVLGLTKGQSVWIQTGEGAILGGRYTTFTGVLLL